MKTIVEVDNKQYVRDVIVYNSETQEPLVVTDSTPLLYLQRRGFKNIKTKEVPETWEELKELCKNLEEKNVFIINDGYCIVFNGFSGLYFWKNGNVCTIEDSNTIWAMKTKVTPAQMWEIIKNLIGEE